MNTSIPAANRATAEKARKPESLKAENKTAGAQATTPPSALRSSGFQNFGPRATAWPRLTAAVRAAIALDTRDTAAPYGFATRIVARALGPKHAAAAPILVSYAMRALGISCLLAILLVSINLGAILRDIDDEAATLGDTPIETADIDSGIATDTNGGATP